MEENKNVIEKFLDPIAIIAELDVKSGSVAVDFGCGPGYFSLPFAKAVGDQGRVYSLDILPHVLETVIGKAKNSGITNIITKRVNLEKENGTKLEDVSADWVILKDILFQNQDKLVIIKEAYRVLKSGGKAIIVEWNQNDSAVGPVHEIRIPQVTLEKMFSDQNFIIEKNIEAGDFHYSFVAVKNDIAMSS
jgi:ubiquinone/menaquinone biosynthesis C-methylase UbiE